MIYIHIPFCRQICGYCDFHHSASLLKLELHLSAIKAELSAKCDFIKSPSTLYIGGGTPSVCSAEQISELINHVRKLWNVENFDELTIEANPEDLTKEYLESLLAAGVNRLSIGIQSFHDEHLRLMNRRHSAARAIQAVSDAQKAGFKNITIDLIYALPFMSYQQWVHNIESALKLGVEHISAYHLTIEPNTIFAKRKIASVEDGVSEAQFSILHNRLISAGYEHYEVSNFALAGYRAVHNSGYWHSKPYLGVGASAHSYDGARTRYWNVSSNKLYLDGARWESENLSDNDLHNEYIMTRLRCVDGVDLSEYKSSFGQELNIVNGLLTDGSRAWIPSSEFLTSDSIISSLFR